MSTARSLRLLLPVVALALTARAVAAPAAAKPAAATPEGAMAFKRAVMITLPGHLQLRAKPDKVWAAVTSLKGYGALTGVVVADAAAAGRSLAKVGEAFVGSLPAFKDTGRLVVTYVDPAKELRVFWEPDNGSYLCASRITLRPAGAGTVVELTDRYTDDQPNADQTAAGAQKDLARGLEAFRKLVDK